MSTETEETCYEIGSLSRCDEFTYRLERLLHDLSWKRADAAGHHVTAEDMTAVLREACEKLVAERCPSQPSAPGASTVSDRPFDDEPETTAEERRAACGECGGAGSVDSGGFTPWGSSIDVPCPVCSAPAPASSGAESTPGQVAYEAYKQSRGFLHEYPFADYRHKPPHVRQEWEDFAQRIKDATIPALAAPGGESTAETCIACPTCGRYMVSKSAPLCKGCGKVAYFGGERQAQPSPDVESEPIFSNYEAKLASDPDFADRVQNLRGRSNAEAEYGDMDEADEPDEPEIDAPSPPSAVAGESELEQMDLAQFEEMGHPQLLRDAAKELAKIGWLGSSQDCEDAADGIDQLLAYAKRLEDVIFDKDNDIADLRCQRDESDAERIALRDRISTYKALESDSTVDSLQARVKELEGQRDEWKKAGQDLGTVLYAKNYDQEQEIKRLQAEVERLKGELANVQKSALWNAVSRLSSELAEARRDAEGWKKIADRLGDFRWPASPSPSPESSDWADRAARSYEAAYDANEIGLNAKDLAHHIRSHAPAAPAERDEHGMTLADWRAVACDDQLTAPDVPRQSEPNGDRVSCIRRNGVTQIFKDRAAALASWFQSRQEKGEANATT